MIKNGDILRWYTACGGRWKYDILEKDGGYYVKGMMRMA